MPVRKNILLLMTDQLRADCVGIVSSVLEEPRYKGLVKRWEALWRLEDMDLPCWLLNTMPAHWPLASGAYPLTRYFRTKEIQARAQMEVIQWREAVEIGDMFVLYLQPLGGVTVFASAFGCEVQFFEHTLPWAHPLIQEHDEPESVYRLDEPSVTNGQLGEMLDMTDYLVEQTQNRYPVAVTDMQGPIDTAYLVWEPSAFLVAMYTNPTEVHHLLRLTTDLIVRYVHEQRSRSAHFNGCHYPGLFLPDGEGIGISDDALAVLSANLYEEFGLPYVNALSEEFGGIFIHSCGNFVHQFGNLDKVHRLRGLNFGASETPFSAVWDHFNGRTVIAPHLGLNKDIHFENNLEFAEHVLRHKTHNRGLIIVQDVDPTMREASSIADLAASMNELIGRYA